MRLSILNLVVILSFALPGSANPSRGAVPVSYSADYVGQFHGLPVRAKAHRELRKLEDGTWRITFSVNSMFIDISETSDFTIQDNRVLPIRYTYRRKGIGKNKDETTTYNWQTMTADHRTGNDRQTLELQPRTLDRLLSQQQLRQDVRALWQASSGEPEHVEQSTPELHYLVANGDQLKEYRFRIAGHELLDTKFGPMQTVRVERVRENSEKQTHFWLAIEFEYLLVRLRQTKGQKVQFEINLKAIDHLGGHQVESNQ